MQLKKVLKKIIMVLPVMAIAACSSYKNVNNEDKLEIESNINREENAITSISDQDAFLQKQDVQKNNIVYFEFNKYDIRPEDTHILDMHADFLRTKPNCTITIEGHTDERGTPEYNIALGERRANAVKMYLQTQGISEDRMTIISYGKDKQLAIGHEESSYAKNRRSVILY
ncbi:peptidoglycan-associated lipoprotein [secondary endosymbiont of Heteropsylla cubana]|uniref:Peptidoglycan-associated lipoprotein n=1 Tax=secondary endosymbiont of Heteropsylla cubana TaxID=134287 RepID=J3Z571_9ENTR|nr:peptidoglycan-associated lipoprotein Pal [secondary endosymbiont of Heteropsylla cubana]AFP85459.1 peptidoglycan-associated lipoprotein [secondary endosymbiont of Heteropsylla cubana]